MKLCQSISITNSSGGGFVTLKIAQASDTFEVSDAYTTWVLNY